MSIAPTLEKIPDQISIKQRNRQSCTQYNNSQPSVSTKVHQESIQAPRITALMSTPLVSTTMDSQPAIQTMVE